MLLVLFISLLSCALAETDLTDHVNIKINAPKPVVHSEATPAASEQSTIRVYEARPAAFTLPPYPFNQSTYQSNDQSINQSIEDAWRVLSLNCYHYIDAAYDYTICPYQNITQKSRISKQHVTLGIYEMWINQSTESSAQSSTPNPSLILSQHFVNGSVCHTGPRSTTLSFHCPVNDMERMRRWQIWLNQSTNPSVDQSINQSIESLYEFATPTVRSVEEPSTCAYQVEFETPIVCNSMIESRTREVASLTNQSLDNSADDSLARTCLTALTQLPIREALESQQCQGFL